MGGHRLGPRPAPGEAAHGDLVPPVHDLHGRAHGSGADQRPASRPGVPQGAGRRQDGLGHEAVQAQRLFGRSAATTACSGGTPTTPSARPGSRCRWRSPATSTPRCWPRPATTSCRTDTRAMAYFTRTIRLLNKHKIKPLIVVMPYQPRVLSTFYSVGWDVKQKWLMNYLGNLQKRLNFRVLELPQDQHLRGLAGRLLRRLAPHGRQLAAAHPLPRLARAELLQGAQAAAADAEPEPVTELERQPRRRWSRRRSRRSRRRRAYRPTSSSDRGGRPSVAAPHCRASPPRRRGEWAAVRVQGPAGRSEAPARDPRPRPVRGPAGAVRGAGRRLRRRSAS